MKSKIPLVSQCPVEDFIRSCRGQRIILAADLARTYGVSTKRLNEAIKRNADRFPLDFMFRLTLEEAETLRRSRSQFATLKRGQNIKHLPYAFTEHGAIMAANVLNSPRAVQMSVLVVRAFVKMRAALGQTKELADKLAELERKLTARLDDHENAINHIFDEIKKLMEPVIGPETKHREIGFHIRDAAGSRTAAKARQRRTKMFS